MSERFVSSVDYFENLSQHLLKATKCNACNEIHFPPRPICSECGSNDLEIMEMSGKGKLAAFSVIYVAPTAMIAEGYGRNNPYCAGIVEMEEGPKISAQILGMDMDHPENIKIGMPLTAGFIDRGVEGAKKTYLSFQP